MNGNKREETNTPTPKTTNFIYCCSETPNLVWPHFIPGRLTGFPVLAVSSTGTGTNNLKALLVWQHTSL